MENKNLILQELQTVELKESWRDEYLKTICAFARSIEPKNIIEAKTDLKTDGIDDIILGIISSNSNISIPNIAKKIGRGLTATKDRIAKLKNKGIIDRVGPYKGGHWKVLCEEKINA